MSKELKGLTELIVPRIADITHSIDGEELRMEVALPLLASHVFGDSYARAPLVSELLTYVAVSGGSTDDFLELFRKAREYVDDEELELQASALGVRDVSRVSELMREVRRKAKEFIGYMYELV